MKRAVQDRHHRGRGALRRDAAAIGALPESKRQIRDLIDTFDATQAITLEQKLFKERRRLVDAERTLQRHRFQHVNRPGSVSQSRGRFEVCVDLTRRQPFVLASEIGVELHLVGVVRRLGAVGRDEAALSGRCRGAHRDAAALLREDDLVVLRAAVHVGRQRKRLVEAGLRRADEEKWRRNSEQRDKWKLRA